MAETKVPKIIIQESKSNDLLREEDQFPDEIVGECEWPLVSGPRKGQPCNAKTFDGNIYCTTHQVADTRRKEKEEKQKGKVYSNLEKSDIPLIPLTKQYNSPPQPQFNFPQQNPFQMPQFNFPQYQQPVPPAPQPQPQERAPYIHNTRKKSRTPLFRSRLMFEDEEEESLLSFSEMYKVMELFSNTMIQMSNSRNDNNYE